MITNNTTRRLEAFGRTNGIRIQVRKIESSFKGAFGVPTGVFFILSLNDDVYEFPKKIGVTVRDAEEWIKQHRAEGID